MISSLAKLLLTSTAIAPILIVYAWLAYKASSLKTALILVGLCIALISFAVFLIQYSCKKLQSFNFRASNVEAADNENISFLVLYLMPLFTAEFTQLNWDIWIPAILVFGLVISGSYSYHFNPLLGLLGWHFYKVSTPENVSYIFITKKHINNTKSTYKSVQLTEYIILDIEGSDNE